MTDKPERTIETGDFILNIYGKNTSELLSKENELKSGEVERVIYKPKKRRKVKQYQDEVRIITKQGKKTTNDINCLLNDYNGFYYEDMDK